MTVSLRKDPAIAHLPASIIEDSGAGMISGDLDGTILSWNRAAERIFGYQAEEMIAQSLAGLAPASREHDLFEILERVSRGEVVERPEMECQRKDGRPVSTAWVVSPLRDEGGEVAGASIICFSFSNRAAARQEASQARKELDALAHAVSHDLRAPLFAIDGFSRLLLERHAADLSEEPRRMLGIVRKNAFELGSLIDALLNLYRLGRQVPSKQQVRPAELVRQALADLSEPRQGREVEIRIGDLPGCDADPQLLRQLFSQLLSNALKFTSKCDRARIEVGAIPYADLDRGAKQWAGPPRDVDQGSVVYFVRDNGAGFDMRQAGRLFRVFQRLHRTEDYEGIGTGLAMAHRIVAAHRGRIWAVAGVNQGTVFYFTLDEPAMFSDRGSPPGS